MGHWAGLTSYLESRGSVFVKQSKIIFAEFLKAKCYKISDVNIWFENIKDDRIKNTYLSSIDFMVYRYIEIFNSKSMLRCYIFK